MQLHRLVAYVIYVSMNLTETTLSKQTLLDGIVFDVERIDVALADGTRSKRDIVRHRGGVGILARSANGEFLLVRQFRKAIESESLEIVAGMRDPGENPQVTGERELLEETGYKAKSIHYLGRYLPSPGYTDEVDDLFFAELETNASDLTLDADERLVVERYPYEEMTRMFHENKIVDGKSIAAWFFAKDKGYI
ncbi:NUDIX hydrolase [Kiritimatiellota bacterium B12222]|nr:NUDIX hydrolase [Kiritimatiellota bacterium B12222]